MPMTFSQEQFEKIADLLQVQRGNVVVSNLQLLKAVLHVVENGCKWRALPPSFACPETTAPNGVSGFDILYCDSTAHRWKKIENNGTSFAVGGTLAGTTGNIGVSALTAGQCASGTITLTGSTTSMTVSVSPNTYPGDGMIPWGYVSASGTVTVKVCAVVSGTPTSSTYNVRVIQ